MLARRIRHFINERRIEKIIRQNEKVMAHRRIYQPEADKGYVASNHAYGGAYRKS